MPTKSRERTTIELNPGDKARLQEIAYLLGYVQPTGPSAGKAGSVSGLMQAIANSRLGQVVRDDTGQILATFELIQ